MNTQTRLKLTLITAAFLALVTLLSLLAKMETVATASIAGIMTILTAYIWSQTTRPSKDEYTSVSKQQKSSKHPAGHRNHIRNMDALDKQ
ncbi:MAG: hypothetical protein RL034_1031 [Bacteroidota bacterium]|jgi:hypothetical protein